MQVEATQKNARPVVAVEHLMSNFDNFYDKVVSHQLMKDRESVKKKYENSTALGENEQKYLGLAA